MPFGQRTIDPATREREKNQGQTGEVALLIVHASEALGGGVQTAIARYATLLSRDQHVVLARARAKQATYDLPENTIVELYEGSTAGYLSWLRRRVVSIEPEVVHLHSSFAGLARPVFPKNVAVAYSPHCFAFERRDISPASRQAFRLIEWVLSWKRQLLVAVSPHEMDVAHRLNKRLSTVYVPNSLPLRAVEKSHDADKRGTVTMVGRIGPQKQPHLFAAVASELRDRIDFVWVGDGDVDSRRALESAGVRVTGWLGPNDAMSEVSASELYFHCASWEGAPFAAIEAASLGTPVIALDIPSMSSIGYRTVGLSPSEIVPEILSFFENRAHRELVAQQTQDVVTRFSDDELRGFLRGAYESAVAKLRRARSPQGEVVNHLDLSRPSTAQNRASSVHQISVQSKRSAE